jgi:heme-degrading monooxygenase HmoA
MIVRIWRTGVDPDRVAEYRMFAEQRSLPMFRSQTGFLGVLFVEAESDVAVISFWQDRDSAEALERSATYKDTVTRILAAGFLSGEQSVASFEVAGGELTDALSQSHFSGTINRK